MERLRGIFYIDYRSLRLFRFGLGVFAISDVFLRLFSFNAFHTGLGVLPKELLNTRLLSLFLVSDSPWWATFLFACIVATGVLLILSKYPRTASLFAFLLAVSLRNRNPMVLYGGDDLFRLGLLWSAFLPSGPTREGETKFCSLASMGALLQIAALYISAGLAKRPENWLFNPNATFVSLSSDTYAKPLSRYILGYPVFLQISAVAVFFIERVGWLAFFSPWRQAEFRLFGFALFASMHLVFGMFLHLELFPLIDITFLTLALPDKFWDRLGVKDEAPVQIPHRAEPVFQGLSLALISMLLYVNLMSSPAIAKNPGFAVRWLLGPIGLYQSWTMFYPIDGMTDGYYRVFGRTGSGQLIDEMNQKLLDSFPSKPVDPQAEMGGFRWTRYFEEIYVRNNGDLSGGLVKYLCSRWTPNVPGAEKREISIYHFREITIVAELPIASQMRTLYSGTCDNDRL